MRRRVLSSVLPGFRRRRRMRRRVLSSIFALQPSHLTFPKLIVPVKALGNRQAAAVKNFHLRQIGKTWPVRTREELFSLEDNHSQTLTNLLKKLSFIHLIKHTINLVILKVKKIENF
jgi:hypothetical protein